MGQRLWFCGIHLVLNFKIETPPVGNRCSTWRLHEKSMAAGELRKHRDSGSQLPCTTQSLRPADSQRERVRDCGVCWNDHHLSQRIGKYASVENVSTVWGAWGWILNRKLKERKFLLGKKNSLHSSIHSFNHSFFYTFYSYTWGLKQSWCTKIKLWWHFRKINR